MTELKKSDFYFDLPKELIAQDPLADRASSRLLCLDKYTGATSHHVFREVVNYLKPGDCLVLNNTKVIPARLYGVKEDTGAAIEVLLLKRKEDNQWETLVRPGKKCKPGTRLVFGEGLLHAVDDSTKNERMKADLITNVSHDIKTPLTSIINYVNLMKLEKIDNERVQGYIKILDEKSQRLKQLTADLVEASKISSGNVKLDMQVIDLVELVYQTSGEFNEKFEQKELTIVTKLPKTAVLIRADGRQLYRVIENLYNNVAKYALEKTRVYVDIAYVEEKVVFSIKNVSEHSLARENSNAGDLTERFIRGDSSRTTEGSGLGLSIAKSLTVLMGGVFDIKVDGDLFKASITFPQYVDENSSNPKMEEPASEDDYEIEELEPEERTEKE